jgi:hypothetical protein
VSGHDDASRISPRWLIIALCALVVLVSLGFAGWAWSRTGESNPVDGAQALRSDAADPAATREELRELAQDFVVEFHTYGPDDLVDGELAGYRDRVSPMMTTKFQTVFAEQIALPAATVAEADTRSEAEAHASGLVTADADSAEVIVGGVVQTSYENPTQKDGERIDSGLVPIRYRVLFVRTDGQWLVDDLDQVGDELPGFAEQGGGSEGSDGPDPSGLPTPSDGATGGPTDDAPADPTAEPSEEGETP